MQFVGHTGTVYDLAFSNDGRVVASGGGDNTLRLWDVATGQEIVAPIKHKGDVLGVSCSPVEPIVVSAATNKLHMVDLTTGEIIGQADHRHNVYRVAFSPDGRFVASGGNDNRVYFYDAKAGNLLGSGDWQAGDITAIVYSPDGASVAVGSADRRLKIYNSQTRLRIAEARTPSNVSDLAFSADGTRLFSSDLEGNLRTWDPTTLESVGSIERGVRLQSIATSPTDTLVALAGNADELEVWDYQAQELLTRFAGFAGETLAVSFDPAGTTLAAGGTDDMVTIIALH